MPLFYESIETVAMAIVVVKRALKEGVVEEENYKEFRDYLQGRAKDLNVTKQHLLVAKKNLEADLKSEEEEFFEEVSTAIYKMAEELLEEHEGDSKQSRVCDIWDSLNDEERAAMAELVSAWQKNM
jgi:hypothetical protein